MKIIIGFVIFFLVLFIYLHVLFHLKTSNDLEIYELDEISKEKLEEICDLRQPVIFEFDDKKIMEATNQTVILQQYPAFEVKIRNNTEDEEDLNNDLYLPLPLHTACKLFKEDNKNVYLSENNKDFLQETGLVKKMSYNDEILRPYMVSNCNYDILLGGLNTSTVFRYEVNYRNYFLLTQGSAKIKLAPPQSTRYLHTIYDYENFEFKSPINPWNTQTRFKGDFDKIKCLDLTLTPGKTLYIPANWWYSIKFNSSDTSISCFKYRTYMNNLAILPYIFIYALQMQNVKRNMNKKVILNEKTVNIEENKEEEQNKTVE